MFSPTDVGICSLFVGNCSCFDCYCVLVHFLQNSICMKSVALLEDDRVEKVLVVDDDDDIRNKLKRIVEKEGF